MNYFKKKKKDFLIEPEGEDTDQGIYKDLGDDTSNDEDIYKDKTKNEQEARKKALKDLLRK
jgi:hypothetical protein